MSRNERPTSPPPHVWHPLLCCLTVWQHGGHHYGRDGWVSAAQNEPAAQDVVLGRAVFLLLPDGSPVSDWCECVFTNCSKWGMWLQMHLFCDQTCITHTVCVLHRVGFTGSLWLTPSALVSASSSSPSSCALASPSSMVYPSQPPNLHITLL